MCIGEGKKASVYTFSRNTSTLYLGKPVIDWFQGVS
jgi:hypothetical protein